MFDHWLVVATDTQSVEDIRKAPDDVLSFKHALFLVHQSCYQGYIYIYYRCSVSTNRPYCRATAPSRSLSHRPYSHFFDPEPGCAFTRYSRWAHRSVQWPDPRKTGLVVVLLLLWVNHIYGWRPCIEWVKYPASETLMWIVCRTSNRVFVGAPLCESRSVVRKMWLLIFPFPR